MRNIIIAAAMAGLFSVNARAVEISTADAGYDTRVPAAGVISVGGTAGDVAVTSGGQITLLGLSSVFDDVSFVEGRDLSVNNLGLLNQGSYLLTLTDFAFPTAFEDLKVALTTSSQVITLLSLDEGTRQAQSLFELETTDTYYLSVYGDMGNSDYLGLYGVNLSQLSPVPLPASAWLLLSGIVAWGLSSTKRKRG